MPVEWLCAITGIILLLISPFVYLLLKNERRRPGHTSSNCEKCGYPHKGLPTDRCPECGTRFDRDTGLRKDHGGARRLSYGSANTLLLVIIAVIVTGVVGFFSCAYFALTRGPI